VPAIVIAGEEEFEIQKRVEKLKEKLVSPEWMSFNFVRLSGPGLREATDACAAVPFGPGDKLVLLDRCDLFTKKRGKGDDDSESKSAAKAGRLLDDFEAALAAISPNTYVVFACTANFDSTLKVSKAAKKHAEIQEVEKMKYTAGGANRELITWAGKEAHRFSAVIDDDAVTYLAESTEVDLRQMSSEIQKAATFVLPKNRITREVVAYLSPHFSHVFQLLDHWAYGRRPQVVSTIQELLSRQSALPIVALLQTTLSKWITIKAEAERIESSAPAARGGRREIPIADLARRIAADKRMNDWVVQMELRRMKKLTLAEIVEKKVQLTELELKLKTGRMPEQDALTVFFAV
jgi:DNA polymerase-3 subunit delta